MAELRPVVQHDNVHDDLPTRLEKRQRALTVPELAEALGLGRTFTYELVRRGDIPHLRIGTAVRIDPVEAAAYVRDHTIRRAA